MRRIAALFLLSLACTKYEPKIVPGGNAERGRELVVTYDCIDCHTVPGIRDKPGAIQRISLDGVARLDRISRETIENTPENLVRYLQKPKELNPLTTMPGLGAAREQDARDLAAFLMTLD
jgi:riboflavin synthase